MYKKLLLLSRHSLIKGSAIVFGGTAIVNGLNYVFHLITGRMLGPEQYSILASLISLFHDEARRPARGPDRYGVRYIAIGNCVFSPY